MLHTLPAPPPDGYDHALEIHADGLCPHWSPAVHTGQRTPAQWPGTIGELTDRHIAYAHAHGHRRLHFTVCPCATALTTVIAMTLDLDHRP